MGKLQIFKQKDGRGVTRYSLRFFKEHYEDLGEVKYIILYNADWNRSVSKDPNDWYWFTIVIGENAQLWLNGLTWGYDGEGPYGLYEIMLKIDPKITYKQIKNLEKVPNSPIVYEYVKGELILIPYNNSVNSLVCKVNKSIRWVRIE